MKFNSSVYLFPRYTVFNKEAVTHFESMDTEHSSFLYSTLYLNNVEVLEKLIDQYNIVFCLRSEDEAFMPQELNSSAFKVELLDAPASGMMKRLSEKYFDKYSKNIVLLSSSIGLSSPDFLKIFELLAIEEDAVVIGKTEDDLVPFIGFTKFHEEIFTGINSTGFNYDSYLAQVCRQNYFVSEYEKGWFINNWYTFRKMYIELSKKESLNYCSQKMHELFTHLFIEYKDQLK